MSDARPKRDLALLGASAGGVEALVRLVSAMPGDYPGTVLVVLHVSSQSTLPQILDRAGPLPALHAVDGETIERGRIYVAPPDVHLVVRDGHLALDTGPRRNGHRPAVDILFGSAAAAHGERVVGVVLSGALDDGTVGLGDVKRHGGFAIAQDPEEASNPSMPASAIAHVPVDSVLRVAEIPACLVTQANGKREATGDAAMSNAGDDDPGPGYPGHDPAPLSEGATGYSCPECGGALWELGAANVVRLECRVGHSYTIDAMLDAQGRALEAAMWTALQSLQQREALLRRVAERARQSGNERSARTFERSADDAARRAEVVRQAITERPGRAQEPSAFDAFGERSRAAEGS